jgi:tRNA threonylcarbamoyladenosine biosynthesis protein TsaE
MKIISDSVHRTLRIGRLISRSVRRGDIICLWGQLGSGKTVLAKGIAHGLGIGKDDIVSPTFVLMRQYTNAKIPFYHLDLYRLDSPFEILRLGYEEYFYGDGVTVIEWADRLDQLMPQEYLSIRLSIRGKNLRWLDLCGVGRRYIELVEDIHEDICN